MCDNAISSISPLLDDGECRNACDGDASEICGGYVTSQMAESLLITLEQCLALQHLLH